MLSSIRLTDEELLLRPFHLDDSNQLYCAVYESLQELKSWMSWATDDYSERSAREYIAIARARWEEHTFYAFAVTRADQLLGACTLSSIHPLYHFCNLGYWVRTSWRGQGIAERAAQVAARFAFARADWRRGKCKLHRSPNCHGRNGGRNLASDSRANASMSRVKLF